MMKKLLFLVLLPLCFVPTSYASETNDKLYKHLETMTYEYGLLDKVHKALKEDQLTYRAYAVTYMGKYGTVESAPLLIDALSDESIHVGGNYEDAGMATTRHRAKLALKELTGEDFGFQWNAPLKERKVAIAKYKDWLRERNIIIDMVKNYLKENDMNEYSIYRTHFINKEKTLWGTSLTKYPPRIGAPGLTIDGKTHEIKLLKGR